MKVDELVEEAQELGERVRDLEDLIRWFAAPFGRNRPIFSHSDMYGHVLAHAQRLERIYDSVIGEASYCEICGEECEPGFRRCSIHLMGKVVTSVTCSNCGESNTVEM